MTYAPKSISALARFWIDQGGRSLGIVGSQSHVVGYHLGHDRIFDGSGPGIGWDDYSVQTKRDKAGLTDAASAIDLGRLDGSLRDLRLFSKWLVKRCQADRIASRDIREIIYSPDGTRVQRYSGIDGLIHTGPGNGDSSHTGHSHISFFRDSVARDKVALIAPYFAPTIPDTSTGGIDVDLSGFTVFTSPRVASVPKGTALYTDLGFDAATSIIVSPGRDMPVAGRFDSGPLLVGLTPDDGTTPVRVTWRVVKARDVTLKDAEIPAPPDNTPWGDDDLAIAKDDGYRAGLADGSVQGAGAEKERIALAEANRVRGI
jgi:hypothetical protein